MKVIGVQGYISFFLGLFLLALHMQYFANCNWEFHLSFFHFFSFFYWVTQCCGIFIQLFKVSLYSSYFWRFFFFLSSDCSPFFQVLEVKFNVMRTWETLLISPCCEYWPFISNVYLHVTWRVLEYFRVQCNLHKKNNQRCLKNYELTVFWNNSTLPDISYCQEKFVIQKCLCWKKKLISF